MINNRDVKFAREPMTVILDEGAELLGRHYTEVAHFQDIELDPDVETYLKLEEIGSLVAYTARESGELIGYCVFFIKNNMHFKKSKQAIQDIIFIASEKRGVGIKFIDWCDIQLRNQGVQVVYHHVKTEHNWGPAIEKIGYKLIDLIYGRRLDENLPEAEL